MTVVGGTLCFVPLFDLVGYELSFAVALVSSLAAGVVGACLPEGLRGQAGDVPGHRVVGAALFAAALLTLPPLVLATANAVRVPNCDYFEGLAFYALLPLPSALLSSMIGLAAGTLCQRKRTATLGFVLVMLVSIVWSVARFYATPAIFAYDPFGGFFAGTLYDEVVEIRPPLLTYRAGTLLAIVALACGLSAAIGAKGRLSWSAARRQPFLLALAGLAACGALGIFGAGDALGHRHDAASIAHTLGGRLETRRFIVHYPEGLAPEDARRLGEDCELRLAQVEAFFGVRVKGRLRAYFFKDAEQKLELQGASDTFIAKPWRREVYLQLSDFPHPVLKHEIAHVVAGQFAAGPFRVSMIDGLIPSPGLIEGAAVAAGWERDELTPHQWSRAMIELGIAPRVEDIQGLAFLGRVSAQSYTISGSFCRFLIDRHGARAFRRLYRDGDFQAAYGRPIGALVREWRQFLTTVPLPPADARAARARFDRPSIFGKACAHENAQLRARARSLVGGGNDRGALRLCREIVANDPGNVRDRIALLRTMVRAGELAEAERTARQMEQDRRLGEAASREASERLADIAWIRGDVEAARWRYERLVASAPSEDDVRMLTVKAIGTRSPPLEATLRAFLLGDRGGAADAPLAILLLREQLERTPDSPVVAYLLGRQLWNQSAPELARPYFEKAAMGDLPDVLAWENVRLLGAAAYLTGDPTRSRAAFDRIVHDGAIPIGLRDEALDWLDRLDHDAGRALAARSTVTPGR